MKCQNIDIPIGEDILYTMHFPDEKVICAQDEDDTHNMIRKLHEEYFKWGLQVILTKT